MKAVLLQSMWINGVSVVYSESGPNIADVPDDEYESLIERGVIRPVERTDVVMAEIEDAVIVDAPVDVAVVKAESVASVIAEAGAEAAAAAAAAKPTKKTGKADTSAADVDL